LSVVVAYRHAAYDTPWWVMPSSRPGRFNRAFEAEATQYLSLHPLGPTAERLRHGLSGPDPALADQILINLFAGIVDDDRVQVITFDNCESFGITPDELVGSDYQPTQQLAGRIRAAGATGLKAPSAALPGTDNLVLFGPRVSLPYLEVPVTADEWPTGHLSDGARPAREILGLVCWLGSPHLGLEHWKSTGDYPVLDDPIAIRW
jgi:hypothetical protein